jgi:hypothetical protein
MLALMLVKQEPQVKVTVVVTVLLALDQRTIKAVEVEQVVLDKQVRLTQLADEADLELHQLFQEPQ